MRVSRRAPGRLLETWAATGMRLPLVAASWLVRREYLVTVCPTEVGAVPRPRSGARWNRIQDPAEWPGESAPALGGPAEIQRRLDQGQECWVAWIDGEPAHWRWETARSVFLPYLGKTLCLGPRDYGVVEVYTAPRFRGRGLHTEGTVLALERAWARGSTRFVGLVAWWNRPARHVMEVKMARTVVGAVGYWRVGAARRYFVRGSVRLEPEGIALSPDAAAGAPAPGSGTGRRTLTR